MQTISQMLENAAMFEPADKVALITNEQTMTYRHLNENVNRLSNGLIEQGVKPGDRVMLFMTNSLELVMSYFAVVRAGAAVTPLNVMYRQGEIDHIGRDTGSRALIADADLWDRESQAFNNLPDLDIKIVNGDSSGNAADLQKVFSFSREHPRVKISPDDLASIIYTSGTTGRPKGATQTHRSIGSNVAGCLTRNKFRRDDRLLCALPLFNNFALNVVMMSAMSAGAVLVVIPRFEARQVLDAIQKHQCSYFAGTPTMFSYLLMEYDPDKDNLDCLKVTNSGGAHCPASLVHEVEKTFDVIHMEGYGQTEGCGYTTLNPRVGPRRDNSVGTPISNIFVKIVDQDEQELPVGQVGEIIERGDAFSIHGYWRRPEINREVYRNGWFHSGDLGRVDEDGYLYVVDRKQDLIITGGSNIYPAEVEEVLYTNPKVALAAVVGVPDPVKGELPKGLYCPQDRSPGR